MFCKDNCCRIRSICWSSEIIISDPNTYESGMQILERSHIEIITVAGILLSNIRIHCTLRVIPTALGGMRPGTIFRVECVAITKRAEHIWNFPRNSPCPRIPICVLSARRNRVHAIQNDLTYEHRSLKSLNAYLREILYIELR